MSSTIYVHTPQELFVQFTSILAEIAWSKGRHTLHYALPTVFFSAPYGKMSVCTFPDPLLAT